MSNSDLNPFEDEECDVDFKAVLKLVGERSLQDDVHECYPDDNGLLCLKIYMQETYVVNHDAHMWDSWGTVLNRICDKVNQIPEVVKCKIDEYVLRLFDSAQDEHERNNRAINKFRDEHPALYTYAIKLHAYHYKSEMDNELVVNLAYTPPPVFEVDYEDDDEEDDIVEDEPKSFTWYSKGVLRQGLGKGKENSAFLTKVLNSPDTKEVLVVPDEGVFDELVRDFPNFRDVVNFYKAQFRLCAMTGRTRISPILLLGPPGVGKTLFSKKLAQVLKTGFTFIDMASASSAWVLSGLHASWHGAKSGKIFDAMLYSPTASPIVVLDELEKPVNPERDPKNALYQLLEENSASEFVDEFVDYPVNLSSIIYIACANGLDGISEPLLTRFKIFDIAPPSIDEQAKIVQSMYLAEIEGSSLFETKLDTAIIDSLVFDSLRVAKQKISDAVGMALLEHTPAEIKALRSSSGLAISLELRHFKSHHKKVVAKLGF